MTVSKSKYEASTGKVVIQKIAELTVNKQLWQEIKRQL